MDNLLSINPGLAIWTVVSFLVFLFLLRKIAWGPILQALEKREKGIEEAIRSAEHSREEGGKILAEQKQELQKARDEARGIVTEATADAGRRGDELIALAKKEAEGLLERARTEIRFEETQAVDKVRHEAVDIALDAAKRLLGRTLTGEDHRRMVEEFIAESTKAAGEKNG